MDNDGSKNYITNGHAEINTTGWATYADAAGATPVDGTGGAPNVTFTRSVASPLSGDASFLLTKDAANRQGQGASYDFTLERADNVAAQNMIIQFSYETGGTFTSGASSDLLFFIYDVTNASVITPTSNYIGGASGKVITTFLTDSTSSSYRLIFHVATTSASAWTLKLDRISVRPIDSITSASGSDSSVVLSLGNGFGSTNTNVRRYTNSSVLGTALSYTDSATDGGLITVNQEGTYCINRLDRNTGAASNFGVTKNDVAATGINAVAAADRLSYVMTASNLASNAPNPGTYLYIGDEIRACDDSGAKTNDTSALTSVFSITKVKEPSLPVSFIVATGGTITTDGNYKVHTFTSSGTFQISAGTGTVESLVIGGGGGGGSSNSIGGGGGAGRMIHTTPGASYGIGSYTVTVGAGGAGGTTQAGAGSNGGSSAFDSISAAGGGGGGGYGTAGSATNGSGGGAGGDNNTGAGVLSGGAAGLALSSAGGANNGDPNGANPSGGGGGAGAAGQATVSTLIAGAGGAGSANSISGASVTYAGGGGGSALSTGTAGAGGSGGGGAGGLQGGAAPTAGTANTGGGGGGGAVTNGGAAGGSGVVIVRYQFQ